MPRVVHFEIVSEDPERAMRFYSELLDWSFSTVEGHANYWRIRTGPDGEPGIDGGLTRPYFEAPEFAAGRWICTVEVESLDGYPERIEACGGTIAVPRFAIEGVGSMLHARDPDGNVFGLIEKTRS
jgi:predicted enzyme related to lactoylglutathione lyase